MQIRNRNIKGGIARTDWKFISTTKESENRVSIIDSIDYVKKTIALRTIEGDDTLRISLEDADVYTDKQFTPEQKIKIGVNVTALSTILDLGIGIYDNDDNFLGKFSSLRFKNSIITVSGSKAEIEILASATTTFYLYLEGVLINTSPVRSLNFTGSVSAIETSSGHVRLEIQSGQGITVEVDSSAYSSNITTLNFIGISSAISFVSPDRVDIDLTRTSNILTTTNHDIIIHSGSSITSGTTVLSAIFPQSIPPTHVMVAINGVLLEYHPISSLSDFDVNGTNLELNIDNIGYPLDPNDKIQIYYWI